MDLDKFRITHSTLIEHYQFIESHLEGIYAAISGKRLIKGLQDVERYSLLRIISEIKTIERKEKISVFTKEEYEQLEQIIQKRNFWCHNCYYDIVFDRKTGGPKMADDVKNMILDLREAEDLREELYSRQMELFERYRERLI